jgi:hypothetical protein
MSASEEAIDDGTRMGRDDRAENGKASTMLFHLSLLVPFQIRYSSIETPSSACASPGIWPLSDLATLLPSLSSFPSITLALKALRTGSLSIFVDIRHNFGRWAIAEDSII